jgi:hypothetical protein
VLEAPRAARLAAVAVTALAPLQFRLEIREDRSWEINLATVVLIWLLLKLAESDIKVLTPSLACSDWRVDGLSFYIEFGLGLGGDPIRGLVSEAASSVSTMVDCASPMALVAGSLAGFWAERNMRELGEPKTPAPAAESPIARPTTSATREWARGCRKEVSSRSAAPKPCIESPLGCIETSFRHSWHIFWLPRRITMHFYRLFQAMEKRPFSS